MISEADGRAALAAQLATELASVVVPDSVTELSDASTSARAALDAAGVVLAAARRTLADLDADIESLPDRHALARVHDAHTEIVTLDAQLIEAATAEKQTAADLDRATELTNRRGAASRRRANPSRCGARPARGTRGGRDTGRGRAVPRLHAGRRRDPQTQATSGDDQTRGGAGGSPHHRWRAREAFQAASRANASAGARREQLDQQREAFVVVTSRHPDPTALVAGAGADRRRRRRASRSATARAGSARAEEAAAAERAQVVAETMDELQQGLRSVRDRVLRSGLEPPAPADDLATGWTQLADWAARTHAEQLAGAAAATVAATEARATRDTTFARFRDDAWRLGIGTTADDLVALRDDVLAHGRDARNELQRIDDALERSRKIAEEMQAAQEEREVAGLVGNLLRSDRFEKWLLLEALGVLVEAASENLFALSSGQYSLRSSDDDEFVVVDHRNADETRSVRTLSGGETFQASLALAPRAERPTDGAVGGAWRQARCDLPRRGLRHARRRHPRDGREHDRDPRHDRPDGRDRHARARPLRARPRSVPRDAD